MNEGTVYVHGCWSPPVGRNIFPSGISSSEARYIKVPKKGLGETERVSFDNLIPMLKEFQEENYNFVFNRRDDDRFVPSLPYDTEEEMRRSLGLKTIKEDGE